ncbi:hypothetical protein PR202_gb03537 [Eleusine coracana subsp. coracana]|uniref:Terpene synthase N-terminal domain-containing protein n=1 Tax=Eleusine coracana subsp. coracana TaxID=191504 RepID=A0AAV5E217_ELECO|nr:hypothetical protein PR202_gb03537 [Eleusine coracana subsp. coracana]
MIGTIRTALRSIGEGEISISAYDTALVSLLGKLDGSDGPLFPSSINWIIQNQLPDGSWGDEAFFMLRDRIISTLACVVALTSWNIHKEKCLLFIRENMWRLSEEAEDWMLVGFEIAFPSLLDMAKNLGLDIPYHEPALKEIYTQRKRKLAKHWTPDGLAHTKNCPVKDIDDTAMGFRLLRLHGYHVDPCILKHFEKDGKFFCLQGESNPSSVTPMYNTYRAAQLMFPGDDNVLRRAEVFCRDFLLQRRASNRMKDKWAIAKDILGEVEYAIDFPWKASLPRIETRMYLEQYGGSSDVWIGKVLHRMTLFCNDLYLDAARADFSDFQRNCRVEWDALRMWYFKNNLGSYGGNPNSALTAYFIASATIFEQQRAAERLGWAHTAVLAETVSSYFKRIGGPKNSAENLEELIDLVPFDDASGSLREAWKQWLMAWTAKGTHGPIEGDTALLLVRTIEIFSGRHVSTDQKLNLWEYSQLEQLTSSICCKLSRRVLAQNQKRMEKVKDIDREVDSEMQELAWRVLQGCGAINRMTRETFLDVVKSFCYVTYYSQETIDSHINQVIFQDVV